MYNLLNKIVEYIFMPFRHGGLGALLGGATIIFIGELLEKFVSMTLGHYGAIPGFLIKIGALCLCFGYSSQTLRAVYMGEKEIPYWGISSLEFVDLLERLLSILISLIYAIIFTLIFFFVYIGLSGQKIDLIFFLKHLNNFGFLILFAIFFPAVYFWQSIFQDDLSDTLNPVLVFNLIVKSMPYYLILILTSYFVTVLFLYFKINFAIISSFIVWFIKFYLLVLFSLIVAEIFKKADLINDGN